MPIYHAQGNVFECGQGSIEMVGFMSIYDMAARDFATFQEGRVVSIWQPGEPTHGEALGERAIREVVTEEGADVILEAAPPQDNLRFVYAFYSRRQGYSTLGEVAIAVTNCLNAARALDLRTIGLVPLRWSPFGNCPPPEQHYLTAAAMVAAIDQWEVECGDYNLDVVLCDLRGGFGYEHLALNPFDPQQIRNEDMRIYYDLAGRRQEIEHVPIEHVPQEVIGDAAMDICVNLSKRYRRLINNVYEVEFWPVALNAACGNQAEVIFRAEADLDGIIFRWHFTEQTPEPRLSPAETAAIHDKLDLPGMDLRLFFPECCFIGTIYNNDGTEEPR